MKINDNFILKEMAGQYIAVPVGDYAVDFNGVITLNETAKFMWEKCCDDVTVEALADAVMKEYNVDAQLAKTAVDKFLKELKEAGCLDG